MQILIRVCRPMLLEWTVDGSIIPAQGTARNTASKRSLVAAGPFIRADVECMSSGLRLSVNHVYLALTCGERETQGIRPILIDDFHWVHHISDGLAHLPPLPISDLHNCHGSS